MCVCSEGIYTFVHVCVLACVYECLRVCVHVLSFVCACVLSFVCACVLSFVRACVLSFVCACECAVLLHSELTNCVMYPSMIMIVHCLVLSLAINEGRT